MSKITIGFSKKNKLLSKIIRWITRSKASHAWISYYNTSLNVPEIIEASWFGYKQSNRKKWEKKSKIIKEFEINNENGNTKGEFIFGDVTIKQPTGKIDLQWIEGDIRLKSLSAVIDVNQVRGALDITSQTGDVYIRTELDSPRNYFVKTNSGSVKFKIPEMSPILLFEAAIKNLFPLSSAKARAFWR